MPAPAGPPHLPVIVTATALALLSPLELTAAETRDEIKQAIHFGLPRYDPAVYEKAQAEKAARSVTKHAPAPLPEAKPAAPTAPLTAASSGEKILELPTMTVRGEADLPMRLPRVVPPARPVKNLKGEPLESAAGRDARLIKKHLPKLTQALNSKKAQIALARQAEFREQRAAQLNELAAGIELQAAFGLSPEEIKKLRAEYLKLYYSGPK